MASIVKKKDGSVSESLTESRESSSSSSVTSSSEGEKIKGCASPSPLGWPIKKAGECKSLLGSGDSGGQEKNHHLEDSTVKKLSSKFSEIDMMKERFAKLLLGEDMSGSGKGVCTALAISNAITNLCGMLCACVKVWFSVSRISINTFVPEKAEYPIIYGADAPNRTSEDNGSYSRYCEEGSLNSTLVKGKIVFCDDISDGEEAIATGAVGSVMQGEGYNDFAFTFPLPVSYLDITDGDNVKQYLNSTSEPTATIMQSIEKKDELAPYVISFSSRGPNPITTDILKPDLTAPGVDILAAWTGATTVTGEVGDTRVVPYNIISGTSMSCPHATGAAAYVKSFHPTWSPAAIKSALMTTAASMSAGNDTEFAYGSGHIDPLKAADPGLVYDAGEIDYVKFLCGQGYNATQLKLVTGDDSACSNEINGTVWDLNYPSFALSTKNASSFSRVFQRTVTNVGSATSSYKAIINAPQGLKISVSPDVLSFTSVGQKLSFQVSVEANVNVTALSGSLVWDDGVHQVRTPVVAFLDTDEDEYSGNQKTKDEAVKKRARPLRHL